ncbi:hypothetical protein ACFQPG_07780 [Sphingomonas sp. GCM10030256]|uniref:hypothetical protein n=1 Tax=Sphingomonas sp. GCM10030256 TaxID=3273427 RepID=UPI003615F7E2
MADLQLGILNVQATNEAVSFLKFLSTHPAFKKVTLVLLASKLLLANAVFRIELPD